MVFNPTVSEESILQTCARIARKGEMYHVNSYRYGENNKRKTCFKLKKQGKLKQGPSCGKLLTFYRPEDLPIIEAAEKRFQKQMKKVHAQNVTWHLEQAESRPELRDYHIKEAEKERLLSQ